LLFKGPLLGALLPFGLGVRLAATVAIVAPVAFHMGLPMSLGMRRYAGDPAAMTWGWAVNGGTSVLASVGSILISIHLGIAATFAFGIACYALAFLLLAAISRSSRGVLQFEPPRTPDSESPPCTSPIS